MAATLIKRIRQTAASYCKQITGLCLAKDVYNVLCYFLCLLILNRRNLRRILAIFFSTIMGGVAFTATHV